MGKKTFHGAGESALLFARPLILHPFLFGIYYVCNSFIYVAPQSTRLELLEAVLLISVIIFAAVWLTWLATGHRLKAGLIITWLLMPVLFFPQITLLIRDIAHPLARPRYIFPAFFIGTAVLVALTLRTRKNLRNLNLFLNIITVIYVGHGMVQMAAASRNEINYPAEAAAAALPRLELDPAAFASPGAQPLPDIYYIVMDGYTSSSSLKKYWGYDNSPFDDALRKMGFYIAGQSRSFQLGSPYSISSALNMTNDKKLFASREDFQFEMVKNNIMVNYLRSRGYAIVNLSIFDLPGKDRYYSFYNEYSNYSNLQKLFMYTAVSVALNRLSYINYYPHALDVLSRLKELPALKSEKPRFVYAHIMLPHSYYYFDRNADIIPWFKRIRSHSYNEKNKAAYLEQLIGTNKMMLAVVERIVSGSERPPVIVIQGDHGFRFLDHRDRYIEAFTIFNAYRLPGGCEKFLYDSISPYNTFRVILNCYFGGNLELLAEKK